MKKKKMINCQEGESEHNTVLYGTVPYCIVPYHTVRGVGVGIAIVNGGHCCCGTRDMSSEVEFV